MRLGAYRRLLDKPLKTFLMIGHQNHKPANYNGRGVESRGMKSHKTEEHGSHQSCSLNDPERLILNSLTERKVYQHWRHNISLLTYYLLTFLLHVAIPLSQTPSVCLTSAIILRRKI